MDIDSDEDSEPKEQKTDEKIVVQYKPLRSTWSQLSVVSVYLLHSQLENKYSVQEWMEASAIFSLTFMILMLFPKHKVVADFYVNPRS